MLFFTGQPCSLWHYAATTSPIGDPLHNRAWTTLNIFQCVTWVCTTYTMTRLALCSATEILLHFICSSCWWESVTYLEASNFCCSRILWWASQLAFSSSNTRLFSSSSLYCASKFLFICSWRRSSCRLKRQTQILNHKQAHNIWLSNKMIIQMYCRGHQRGDNFSF